MWKVFDVSLLDDVISWHGVWAELWRDLLRRRPTMRLTEGTQAVPVTNSAS